MDNVNVKYLDMEKYVNTLILIYVKACMNLFGCVGINIDHSINKGLYSSFRLKKEISAEDISDIKKEIKRIVQENYSIENIEMPKSEAVEIFKTQGMKDKVKLFQSTNLSKVSITKINSIYFHIFGTTYENTGKITEFDIKKADGGVVITFPRKEFGYRMPTYEEQIKLFKIYRESEKWAELLGVSNVADLNYKIKNNEVEDLIRVNEALHEKKIAYIADEICNKNSRIVMIAGPSSSGKTTFTQRLGVQIAVNNKKYFPISLDNYFIERKHTPRDENGTPDFDSIDALDIKLFNENLNDLISGKAVRLPFFDFVSGTRSYSSKETVLGEDVFLLIEGIHGLNERLTKRVGEKDKYKIYVSALTELNIDLHNRISTTELRLIRRLVRDELYRGHNGEMTLSLWENVVKGENKYIFPYQENADIMFNSSLLYEIPVLKKHALPVIKSINKNGEFAKIRTRLLDFLNYFVSINDNSIIPNTSIIKEFIGGSCFRL